ncbi:MAG: hypothetical protein NTW86_33255, partial [Candidatus Sumerlaeota bacterium]|nr:hypothetical protein [Candidatus Sumerlaeota bacterium]
GEFTSPSPWKPIEAGPLRAGMMNAMTLGASTLRWQVFAQADEPIVRMRLRVNWNDGQKIVKLLIPVGFDIRQRIDGIPGGRLARECDGKEYPVFDYLALAGEDRALAVVSRDIFSADVQPAGVARLTLLRSPHYCHHDPFTLVDDRYPLTDQGEHDYEIAR